MLQEAVLDTLNWRRYHDYYRLLGVSLLLKNMNTIFVQTWTTYINYRHSPA